MSSFLVILSDLQNANWISIGELEVPVDPIFCKDFDRLGPERELSIQGTSARGQSLEGVVSRIFNEVVQENPDLLFQATKEACQTGTANLLIALTEKTQDIKPHFQNIRTVIDISKKEQEVYVAISLTAESSMDMELKQYPKPHFFKGKIVYQIFRDKAISLEPCIYTRKLKNRQPRLQSA